jgi:hypothetical protein
MHGFQLHFPTVTPPVTHVTVTYPALWSDARSPPRAPVQPGFCAPIYPHMSVYGKPREATRRPHPPRPAAGRGFSSRRAFLAVPEHRLGQPDIPVTTHSRPARTGTTAPAFRLVSHRQASSPVGVIPTGMRPGQWAGRSRLALRQRVNVKSSGSRRYRDPSRRPRRLACRPPIIRLILISPAGSRRRPPGRSAASCEAPAKESAAWGDAARGGVM